MVSGGQQSESEFGSKKRIFIRLKVIYYYLHLGDFEKYFPLEFTRSLLWIANGK